MNDLISILQEPDEDQEATAVVLTATKEMKTTMQGIMHKFVSVETSIRSLTEKQAQQEALAPLLKEMMSKVEAIESYFRSSERHHFET